MYDMSLYVPSVCIDEYRFPLPVAFLPYMRKKIWKTGVLKTYIYMYDIMLIIGLIYKIKPENCFPIPRLNGK